MAAEQPVIPRPIRGSAKKVVQKSGRPPKLTPEELQRRTDARAVRVLELKAIVAAEAAKRGGQCETDGCEVEWVPGMGLAAPLQWHHGRGALRDDRHDRRDPMRHMISAMASSSATTDAELRAELKRCKLLCRRHHYMADAEIRGRNDARKRRLPKAIEPDHLAKLTATPNIRRLTGLRTRLIIELMAQCGMRVSEVCHLRFRDLRQADWRISIRESKTGDRELYLPPALESLMIIWLDRRARELPKSEWLFPTASGGGLSRGNVADALDRTTARAGIPDTHPHALRHTFATEFIRKGGDIATLQDILGHTTGTMSMRYARSNPERVRLAMRGAPS